MYHDFDADLNVLAGRRIAVIGYGNLGRPVAMNLRDSGIPVLIGNLDDEYRRQATADGFLVASIADAADQSDILFLLLPDETLPEIYNQSISPKLRPRTLLVFGSGHNIAFGYVEPPPFVDVTLIAPRTIGAGVREGYLNGLGYLSFLSVAQDVTGQALALTLALAAALGALHMGAVEVTFRQEAELDLFIQQAFLPSLHNLLLNAAELLIAEGYPPETALLDLYVSGELGYSLNKAASQGFMDTLRMYSPMAQYGMLSRAERFADARLRRQMEVVLDEVRSGQFAREWASEAANGYPRLNALRARRGKLPMWALEQQVIAQMGIPLVDPSDEVAGPATGAAPDDQPGTAPRPH